MTAIDNTSPIFAQARAEFDQLVETIRPELHRYCSRMTGSVIDGEDVVQDALAKAYYALASTPAISNMRGWLFRIAHNKAIDHLRRYERSHSEPLEDPLSLTVSEPSVETRELTRVALSWFLELPPLQRSCVILKDVLDYSLIEIADLLDTSVSAVKASLHRGRTRLRGLESSAATGQKVLRLESESRLLQRYVDAFEARDFDSVRAMLADDVRLDLIGRAQRRGAVEVGGYFDNYSRLRALRLTLGTVEGRLAIVVYETAETSTDPAYFILIDWADDRIDLIRDYRYARHVMEDAAIDAISVGPEAAEPSCPQGSDARRDLADSSVPLGICADSERDGKRTSSRILPNLGAK
ncbi:MAG: sigma-70 family RNA polymerase sigma factor [Acidobacteriota bacterium]